jgi:hypothetical protein
MNPRTAAITKLVIESWIRIAPYENFFILLAQS